MQITFKENRALKHSEIHGKKSLRALALLLEQCFEDCEKESGLLFHKLKTTTTKKKTLFFLTSTCIAEESHYFHKQ